MLVVRFIPAGAGNGCGLNTAPTSAPVHPRRRGERVPGVLSDKSNAGSSPQARGTGECPDGPRYKSRFIPAGAGNGDQARDDFDFYGVHPRRRGERCRSSSTCGIAAGSSPQARGTDPPNKYRYHTGRFIPAGAGNGGDSIESTTPPTVHPRRRGERSSPRRSSSRTFGSSPQARGTGSNPLQGATNPRFIPAGAGNGGFRLRI